MKPVGLLVAFVGYTLSYFGWCSLKGPGVGLVDLVVPGRPVVIPGTAGAVGGGLTPADLNLSALNKLTPTQRASLPQSAKDTINKLEPGYTP